MEKIDQILESLYDGVIESMEVKEQLLDLCAVYIVLDCEAPLKDAIWSVNSTMEKAIESEKQLNEMRVGGALTKIIEERVD